MVRRELGKNPVFKRAGDLCCDAVDFCEIIQSRAATEFSFCDGKKIANRHAVQKCVASSEPGEKQIAKENA